MTIAIIGAGHVGGALAKGLSAAGYDILLGVRDPAAPKVAELLQTRRNIQAMSIYEAAQGGAVIIVAVQPNALAEVAEQMGAVQHAILVDPMNTVAARPEPYAHTAEALQALTGHDHIVKAFNMMGFETMLNPFFGEDQADLFIAGAYPQDKEVVAEMAEALGFGCYDFGGYEQIPLLEQLAHAWINLALRQGYGRGIAFKLLQRS
jgi:predicted dinucleotide-binding enzyme